MPCLYPFPLRRTFRRQLVDKTRRLMGDHHPWRMTCITCTGVSSMLVYMCIVLGYGGPAHYNYCLCCRFPQLPHPVLTVYYICSFLVYMHMHVYRMVSLPGHVCVGILMEHTPPHTRTPRRMDLYWTWTALVSCSCSTRPSITWWRVRSS